MITGAVWTREGDVGWGVENHAFAPHGCNHEASVLSRSYSAYCLESRYAVDKTISDGAPEGVIQGLIGVDNVSHVPDGSRVQITENVTEEKLLENLVLCPGGGLL